MVNVYPVRGNYIAAKGKTYNFKNKNLVCHILWL